ncbi:MAG: FtsW/RodA/SpoVE family cell cycle protein [Oscillospiraceae bacterium]|nr:FtsW/RodA/SpoVE family cell cycle protein [Oscillospiraceae bacterium]
MTILGNLSDGIRQLFSGLFASEGYAMVLNIVLVVCHVLAALIAVFIVIRCGRSLLRGKIDQEVWGFFCLADGTQLDLIHWENTIGRARGCDVVLNYPTISRSHAVITRNDDGEWSVFPISQKNPVFCNGEEVTGKYRLNEGDVLSLGGVSMSFFPSTEEEERRQAAYRARPGREISPTKMLTLVTLFQALIVFELLTAMEEYQQQMLLSFGILCGLMWGLYFLYRVRRRTGYEVETLAFFLTTLSLEQTASKLSNDLLKQTFAVVIGLVLFFILSLALRDLEFAKKLRWPMAGCAAAMLAFNVLFGARLFGARNWVSIGPLSFQPSELVKIVFVIAGAATLDRLFSKRNLIGTIVFSAYCVGCLALMSDFGTALIFFVAFLVVAFLRTGDLPSVAMVTAAAAFGCVIIVNFKPYIVRRFSIWRHVWEDTSDLGYQQTRTMSAIASGGLFGTGAGNGWFKKVAASSTDLVFGAIAEELGLIVALCAVAAIVIFALFAVKSARRARSSFYVIAANAVGAMFLTQGMLNVFGSTDILPLTGVTLPFVSTGGSSMMSCWALLAYIKAADTRQNSGFAVRVPKKLSRRERRAMEEQEEATYWAMEEAEDEAETQRSSTRTWRGEEPEDSSNFRVEIDELEGFYDDDYDDFGEEDDDL